MKNGRRVQIAVIGAAAPDEESRRRAFLVGKEIALAGAVLLSGGLGGVMEEASRGAAEADGLVVGIVPGDARGGGNAFLDVEIVTGMGHARNVILARSADALIAVAGGYGTLSEIAVGLKMGKPVIGLGSWDIPGVQPVNDPERAVRSVLEQLGVEHA